MEDHERRPSGSAGGAGGEPAAQRPLVDAPAAQPRRPLGERSGLAFIGPGMAAMVGGVAGPAASRVGALLPVV